jgi:hypothetical protein
MVANAFAATLDGASRFLDAKRVMKNHDRTLCRLAE